ncbi:MAG: hypothetical protein EOP88_18445 [Verrucomicrobiaceae bacterium]|nr:MAG: hypothetical protein EOP88_18445 [Verrucomicrobiaceae bacterium]
MPLAKSFSLHLLAPYAVQLGLAFLLVDHAFIPGLMLMIALGGWVALLISIPFGVLHVLQAIHFAHGGASPWKQFLVGFLNPSLALLTIAGVIFLAPDFVSRLG